MLILDFKNRIVCEKKIYNVTKHKIVIERRHSNNSIYIYVVMNQIVLPVE